jgi:hypothetical protein
VLTVIGRAHQLLPRSAKLSVRATGGRSKQVFKRRRQATCGRKSSQRQKWLISAHNPVILALEFLSMACRKLIAKHAQLIIADGIADCYYGTDSPLLQRFAISPATPAGAIGYE